ncbi:hypothetical protein [Pseudoxanthomonas putridarboris]|uniref:Uncharacterized protein n=1 Tax=Pseudoxanthomonas putridarboris TaxID=752605 RepID=A0ABU9J2Y1_9GAMM
MRYRIALLFLLSLAMVPVGAAEPGVDIVATVTRYSEFELTKRQTTILDEATKVSAAARVFHGLYGRWPNDVQELAARTVGIDFTLFDGKILIDAVPEGLAVTIFDSIDVRRLLATADSPVSSEMKKLAQDPTFRIRVSLQSTPPGGT